MSMLAQVVERRPHAEPALVAVGLQLAETSALLAGESELARRQLTSVEEECFDVVRPDPGGEIRSAPNVTRPVIGFSLDLLDEQAIVASSVVNVTSPELTTTRKVPLGGGQTETIRELDRNGPLSPLMGPIQRGVECETCCGVFGDDVSLAPKPGGVYPCYGHSGHIELPGAIFLSPMTTKNFPVITNMLRCICWECGEMPGTKKKREATIDAVLRCTPAGTPLDRNQRLDIICKAMRTETVCHACQDRLRCAACTDKQCDACARLHEYRPSITSLAKLHGGRRFADFPYVVTWNVEARTEPSDKAAFAAFKARHPAIGPTEMSFNPERARQMWSAVSPEVALLLAPHLPPGPYGKTGDVFERIFGRRNPVATERLKRSAVRAARAFFTALVARACVCSPPVTRPSRIDGDLSSLTPKTTNEWTKGYAALVKAAAEVRRLAMEISGHDNPAIPPLPQPDDPSTDKLELGALLRHARDAHWYELTRADHHLVRGEYGTMQYCAALIVDPSNALEWHPAGSSAQRPNSTLPGAASGKDKGHAPATNLKGKAGRFRSNLTGKRVDFSMRTVITPDPNIDFDELRIPYYCAARLTCSDTINDLNYRELLEAAERRRLTVRRMLDECTRHSVLRVQDLPARAYDKMLVDTQLDRDLVAMGPITLYIWSEDGTEKYDYTQSRRPVYEIDVARRAGSRIDRPMRAGDDMFWNRAPSLQKQSFMSHEVVLSSAKTGGMHPSVTPPYNADFDGDEMNGHNAQMLTAIAEGRVLMRPSANLILQRTSTPVMAQVQDSLLGCFIMTLPGTLFTLAESMDLIMVGRGTKPDAANDPYNDAKPLRLPTPAVMVRCAGTGEHALRPRCSMLCHVRHIAERAACCQSKFECRTHDPACNARDRGLGSVCDRAHMIPYWTGLQLFSLFLPHWFSASRGERFSPAKHGFFVDEEVDEPDKARMTIRHGDIPWAIEGGELIYGVLNKSAVGLSHRNITHQLTMATVAASPEDSTGQYPERTRLAVCRLMRALSRMSVHHVTCRGFSTGVGDVMLDDERVTRQILDGRPMLKVPGKPSLAELAARNKLRIALALYGVRRPPVPSDTALTRYVAEREALLGKKSSVLAEKRALDPVQFSFPRYDLAADDARSVDPALLELLKIPYESNQPGIERQVAAMIQAFYADEARVGERRLLSPTERKAGLETRIRSACETVRDRAHNIVKESMTLGNSLCMMVCAGSKGSWINIGSSIACVGPQSSEFRRLSDRSIAVDNDYAPNSLVRFYPHNPMGIIQGAGAGGMIKTGYIDGCNPMAFVLQCDGARGGLTDTATKTAETGYAQRRIVKITEGDHQAADGTVRNEANRIVSFVPAGARIDARFLSSTSCEPLRMSEAKFRAYGLIAADDPLVDLCSVDRVAAVAAVEREKLCLVGALAGLRMLPEYDGGDGHLRVVGDIGNIVTDVLRSYDCPVKNQGYATRLVATPEWRATVIAGAEARSLKPLTLERAAAIIDDWKAQKLVRQFDFVTLTNVLLVLSLRQLFVRYEMPEEALYDILHLYLRLHIFSRVQPGDAVGVLLAQALGEVLTQMTLRTFYEAGRDAPVTRGVPRMIELLAAKPTVGQATPMVEALFDMLRVYAQLAEDERRAILRPQKTTKESEALRIKHEMLLDEMLGYASIDRGLAARDLERTLAAAVDAVAIQYEWTLDTLFADWAIVKSTTDLPWPTSANLVYSQIRSSGAAMALVARRAVDWAPASIDLMMTNVAAAVMPLLDIGVRASVVALYDDERWVGISIALFGAGKRAKALYDTIRIKRAQVAVACPTTTSPEMVDAMLDDMMRATAAATLDTPAYNSSAYHAHMQNRLIAPLLRELPRVALEDIAIHDDLYFAPLEVTADGMRQTVPIPGMDDDEKLWLDTAYEDCHFSEGCRECALRADPTNLLRRFSYSETALSCLGSTVLVFRLDCRWFSLTGISPETVRDRIAAFLGDDFTVLTAPDARGAYVPLHIRLHTCRLDKIAARAYSLARLKRSASAAPSKTVVVEDPSLASEHRRNMSPAEIEQEQWQIADDRRDTDVRPLTDPSFLREMRIALGYIPSPDVTEVPALLLAPLLREVRRLVNTAARFLPTSYTGTADEHRERIAHPSFAEDMAHVSSWLATAHRFVNANLPAPNRADRRVYAPPPLPALTTPFEHLGKATGLVATIYRLLGWAEQCIAVIDAHTPIWHLSGNHPIPVRPLLYLSPTAIAAMRFYFQMNEKTDPLGLRETGRAAVTGERLRVAHAAMQSELEYNELMRVRTVLKAFCFWGSAPVGEMQVRIIPQATYTPECGAETGDRIVGDIPTPELAPVLAFSTIDQRKTSSNSFHEVDRALGIEAARMALIIQYADVYKMTGPHAPSNHANLALLASIQTSRGRCMPITRVGARAFIQDVLQEASFEQAPLVMARGAVARSGTKTILSPSTAMMLARPSPGFGTSSIDLLLDAVALLDARPPAEPIETTIDEVFPLRRAMAALPDLSFASNMSPFAARDEMYATTHVLPPAHSALAGDIASLGIDQSGSFARHRPDYSTTGGYDPEAPQTTMIYRDTYDPERPNLRPAEYDPTLLTRKALKKIQF